MAKLLLPCDGSPESLLAVRHVMGVARRDADHQIHLVNVQTPLSSYVSRHVDRRTRSEFLQEQAEIALAPARSLLDSAGLNYEVHRQVGDKAKCLTDLSQLLHCDRIVLAATGGSWLARVLANSWTSRLLQSSPVPVEIVNAKPASTLERVGLPTGIGAGLTLLWIT
jgi:nucleotide-binding universal stress UspA family protein